MQRLAPEGDRALERSTRSSTRCASAGTRWSGRRVRQGRSSTTSSTRGRPAGRLDRRAGRRHATGSAPRRRGGVRPQRRARVVEAATCSRRRSRCGVRGARGRRPRGAEDAAEAPALRVHRRALVRPARDRHPGPRLHRGPLRRAATTRPAAQRRLHRRRQLRPGRRHLLLRLDGHRAARGAGFDLALTELLDARRAPLPRRGGERARRRGARRRCPSRRGRRPTTSGRRARSPQRAAAADGPRRSTPTASGTCSTATSSTRAGTRWPTAA